MKYTSPATVPSSTTLHAYLSYNSSERAFVPPDYLKVKVVDEVNSTYYQYALVSKHGGQSDTEPELDEMVIDYTNTLL